MSTSIPEEAKKYLMQADPILGKVIEKVGVLEPTKHTNYYLSLTESIVSQQLSVKVADVIFARFVNLFPDQKVTPEEILKIDTEDIRRVGFSYAKVKYVKALAKHVLDSPTMFETFDELSDAEIIMELVKVNGIGKWTAEMFLIFTMGRPDVFSYGDLGLKNAIKQLYGFEIHPTPEEAASITDKWKPYRSYGSRYLWKSLDLN
ncbi:DNA-3-methyladenine glycosylase [soil metagenome]